MRFGVRDCFLALVAAAALGSTAQAADMYTKARPMVAPVEVYNWTGYFVGAHVGGQWGKVVNECPPPGCLSRRIESVFGGVQAGYNYQMPNNWVLGVWGTVPVVSTRANYNILGANIPAELEWAVAFGGRVGYAYGRVLPFVFVGGVVGGGRAGFIPPGGPAEYDSQTHFGYTVGAGVEYAIDQRWSATLRYAYVDMSREAYSVFAPGERFGFRSDTLAVGVNYRFGGPVVARY